MEKLIDALDVQVFCIDSKSLEVHNLKLLNCSAELLPFSPTHISTPQLKYRCFRRL